jgi:hypothetical protein
MISKKNTGRAFGLCLALVFGTLIAATVCRLLSGLPGPVIVLVYVSLWIGFYFTGIWMIVERPAELDKKFPLSSGELRKRKRAFYDWLDSLGRR